MAQEQAIGPGSWWHAHHPEVPGVVINRVPRAGAWGDVVVVGLGSSGLEAVLALANAGLDVVGLDAVGVAGGAAGANGGFLLAGLADFHHVAVQRHGRAAANSWWHATAEEMDRLEVEEPTFARVGSLRIAVDEDEERDCLIHLAQMRRDGLDASTYEGPEGRGLLIPGDGVVDPVARAWRLAASATTAGARLFAPARVADVTPGAVRLAGGEVVRSRATVIAVDGGLERLLPELEDVRTARLQMLATGPLPPPLLPRPVYRRHGMDWFQQRPGGEVLLGGGRDVGGEQEWGADPVPSTRVQAHLDDVRGQLGLSHAPVTHRWAARVAYTTSRLPVDRTLAPGLHAIGGYCGHGNVIGGLLGRRVAARVLAAGP